MDEIWMNCEYKIKNVLNHLIYDLNHTINIEYYYIEIH